MARLFGWLAEPDAKYLTAAGSGRRPDLTPHGYHEVFGDGEAEAGPGQLPAARGIDFVEPLEDTVPMLGRDAWPVVATGNCDFAIAGASGHLDLRVGRRELDGVVEEIADRLRQFGPVGGDLDRGIERELQTIPN